MSRALHIALPWHAIGHGNLGIDALTRSNIAILRAAAARIGREVRFTTLCAAPATDVVLPDDVTIGPMPRLRAALTGRSPFLAVLRDADLVVDIGEGDSWTDLYGGRRFAFHAGTKLAALALAKPLVLAPQTIGPFASGWRSRLADAIMRRARAVFARDTLSAEYLAGRRLRCETATFIDVAFRLPFTRTARPAGPPRVGLNVSGLLYRGGYHGRNDFALTLDYAALTHRLIDYFEATGAEVHLIPHVTAPGRNDDDVGLLGELRQRHPAVVVPPRFADASAAKSYIAGLDFMVGGRMHACIATFSAGVPVVPIAYSRKFNGLFGTLGYPHFVDGRIIGTDRAFAAIRTAFTERDRLAAAIRPGLALADERLDAYEARLAAILGELP